MSPGRKSEATERFERILYGGTSNRNNSGKLTSEFFSHPRRLELFRADFLRHPTEAEHYGTDDGST